MPPVGPLGFFGLAPPAAFTGKVFTNATASSSHPFEHVIRRHRWVDIDIAFHRASPHLHRPRPWPRKSVTVAVLADTKEQAAFGHGGDQVA